MAKTKKSSAGAPARPCFDAVFTGRQVEEMEATHNTTWGVNRRLMLVTLTKSSEQLTEVASGLLTDHEDAFFDLIQQINDYCDYLKRSIKLADSAFARLMLVGQYLTPSLAAAKAAGA